MNIASNFPFSEFRKHQKETLQWVEEQLKDKRFILINAPTGSGKSVLAIAIARSFSKNYILTPQKSLQQQYYKDFSEYIYLMKGKSNYPCIEDPALNCANGPCKSKKGIWCYESKWYECAFYIALKQAQGHPIVMHNFHSFLYQANHAFYWDKRDVMIIDESHNCEKILMDYVSFKLSAKTLNTIIQKRDTMPEYVEVIRAINERLQEEYKDLKERTEEASDFIVKELLPKMEEIEKIISKIGFFLMKVETEPDNWVFNAEVNEQGHIKTLEIKPIYIKDYAENFLFKYADKVICMSATVEKESFCRSLGINPDDCAYIEIPSTFPVENRPIIKDYVGQLNFKTIKSKLPAIADKIREYLEKHKDEKGLICTQTYEIARYIKENVKDRRLLFHGMETGIGRDDVLKTHTENPRATVLVSPSMMEGLDLKDDLGRWCIMIKLPYGFLGDSQIKARMNQDYKWYVWQTIMSICQASGRCVRSETDHGIFYILDSGFDQLHTRFGYMFPKWFTEAIVEEDYIEVEW